MQWTARKALTAIELMTFIKKKKKNRCIIRLNCPRIEILRYFQKSWRHENLDTHKSKRRTGKKIRKPNIFFQVQENNVEYQEYSL